MILRLYHVKEGKMDALKARFGDHTDAIFKRHNMKSIGYWQPEDPPSSHMSAGGGVGVGQVSHGCLSQVSPRR